MEVDNAASVLPALPHAVPPACADDSNPSFTPDGRHIVFQHEHGHLRSDPLGDAIDRSDIVETDLAGGHATVLVGLTGYRGDVMGPRLSPDGKQLVFERYNSSRARPKGGVALFIVDVGSGNPRRLTPWSMRAVGADWSPDGSRILFKSLKPGSELAPGSNLFTIRPDGTRLLQVTHVPSGNYVTSGSYSPDGTSIVFATDLRATANDRGGTAADVFVMRLGTDALAPVTRTPNLDGWPTWGAHSAGRASGRRQPALRCASPCSGRSEAGTTARVAARAGRGAALRRALPPRPSGLVAQGLGQAQSRGLPRPAARPARDADS